MSFRILIACEYSARVRDAFRALGHDAWSCDLEPCEGDSRWHVQGDVRELLKPGRWDAMICHPPCTYLASSGMHWTVRGLRDPQLTEDALAFVHLLLSAPVPHIALENPVGAISTRIRPPDQTIQPWQFGDAESKATCLWLVNLPPLVATHADGDLFAAPLPPRAEHGRWNNQTANGQNKLPPSKDRWKVRSRTYPGIAQAMAKQWSEYLLTCATACA